MILKELRRFKFAYRLQIMCNSLSAGLFAATLTILLVRLYEVRIHEINIPVWIFLIPIPVSILLSAFKPMRLTEIASKIEKELGLKERLTTSLYFLERKDSYAIFLFHDTLSHTKGVKTLSLFPVKWYRTAALLIPLLFVLFFPYHTKSVESSSVSRAPNHIKFVIKEEGARLKEIADRLKETPSFSEPWEKALIQRLAYIGYSLQSDMINKRDALLMLSEVPSLIEDHDLEKGKGGSDDQEELTKDVEHTTPLRSGPELSDRVITQEIMDSIQLAKKHIAEADPGAGKTGNYTPSSKSGAFSGGEFTNAETKSVLSEKKTFSQGSVKKYNDSVIPLEAIPIRYHTVIKRYFDDIAKDLE